MTQSDEAIRTVSREFGFQTSKPASPFWTFWKKLVGKPVGLTGLLIVFALIGLAIAAPFITNGDPNFQDYRVRLQGPSADHLFGTDQFGRDLFTRIAYGARVSMQVGVLAVVVGLSGGLVFGLLSGFYGGRTDLIIQRFMDAIIAFPALVLAMVMVAVLPRDLRIPFIDSGVAKIMIAIGFVVIPGINRVVRGSAMSVMNEGYIEAANAAGAGPRRIMFLHLLPNIMAPVIVIATALLGSAILIEAGLSFLGLGVPPDVPSWGQMLSGSSRTYFRSDPHLAIFPGLFIMLTVLGINLFGDALRDLLDPRLRGTS